MALSLLVHAALLYLFAPYIGQRSGGSEVARAAWRKPVVLLMAPADVESVAGEEVVIRPLAELPRLSKPDAERAPRKLPLPSRREAEAVAPPISRPDRPEAKPELHPAPAPRAPREAERAAAASPVRALERREVPGASTPVRAEPKPALKVGRLPVQPAAERPEAAAVPRPREPEPPAAHRPQTRISAPAEVKPLPIEVKPARPKARAKRPEAKTPATSAAPVSPPLATSRERLKAKAETTSSLPVAPFLAPRPVPPEAESEAEPALRFRPLRVRRRTSDALEAAAPRRSPQRALQSSLQPSQAILKRELAPARAERASRRERPDTKAVTRAPLPTAAPAATERRARPAPVSSYGTAQKPAAVSKPSRAEASPAPMLQAKPPTARSMLTEGRARALPTRHRVRRAKVPDALASLGPMRPLERRRAAPVVEGSGERPTRLPLVAECRDRRLQAPQFLSGHTEPPAPPVEAISSTYLGVTFTVGIDGRVTHVRVDQSSGSRVYDEAFIGSVLLTWRFRPAMENCRAVPFTVSERFRIVSGP